VVVTPDGQHVVSASEDKTLRVWDLQSGRELVPSKTFWFCVCRVVTPEGRRAVPESEDNTLKIQGCSQDGRLSKLR
jgi:WD40 repeat protein